MIMQMRRIYPPRKNKKLHYRLKLLKNKNKGHNQTILVPYTIQLLEVQCMPKNHLWLQVVNRISAEQQVEMESLSINVTA